MPTSASASSTTGTVSLTSRITALELANARGFVHRHGFFGINAGRVLFVYVQDVKVSIYRSVDINAAGNPTGSPYFGSVTRDVYRNRHGTISTDTILTSQAVPFENTISTNLSATLASFRLFLSAGNRLSFTPIGIIGPNTAPGFSSEPLGHFPKTCARVLGL